MSVSFAQNQPELVSSEVEREINSGQRESLEIISAAEPERYVESTTALNQAKRVGGTNA